MYYEIFESLCKERNVKPGHVSKATGISTATFTSWKKGDYTPKSDKLQKIADYFNVSLDYLTTGQDSQLDYLYTDENAEFLIEVTKMAKNKAFIEKMTKYMSLLNENRKSVDDMIDFLYEKEKKDET